MKKVKRRAWAALLLALALLLGLGLFTWRFAAKGREWVSFSANQNLYPGGGLSAGTLTDRNGVVLSAVEDGKRVYARDGDTRVACLHAVGDPDGNIGTGALRAFAGELSGYTLLEGISGAGGTVALSIDAELNKTAYGALERRKGAVLVADYTTGEILCMASSPSYDPLLGYDTANSWYDGIYLNRCLSAAYTPGSVFKLVTAAAAIENISGLDQRRFTCNGSSVVDGNTVVCTGSHGTQTIEQALSNSCNVAFAELSLELGGETLERYAKQFGFTEQLTVSGIYTARGNFDAAPEGSAALAWSGVGQSTDLVCPLALLRYVSAVANGGRSAEPVLRPRERGGTTRLLSAATAGKLKDLMSYNVVSHYANEVDFHDLPLCAKSGTAEVGDDSTHAWFTGFLDDPEHPYAFVVIIENDGFGLRNAGPVASAVLQAAVSAP